MNSTEPRKFGFNLALGLNILGFIMFLRHKEHFIWFSGIGSLSLILSMLEARILAPLKKVIDGLIFSFGWLVSFIGLMLIFYLVFTPIGILLKLFRKDLLNQKIDKHSKSYWLKIEKHTGSAEEHYERMG